MIKDVWLFLRDYREFVLFITVLSLSGFLLGMYWINFEPSVIEKSWRGQLIPYATWAFPLAWAVTLLDHFYRYLKSKKKSKSGTAEDSTQDKV